MTGQLHCCAYPQVVFWIGHAQCTKLRTDGHFAVGLSMCEPWDASPKAGLPCCGHADLGSLAWALQCLEGILCPLWAVKLPSRRVCARVRVCARAFRNRRGRRGACESAPEGLARREKIMTGQQLPFLASPCPSIIDFSSHCNPKRSIQHQFKQHGDSRTWLPTHCPSPTRT
jgi:hypothetical protein